MVLQPAIAVLGSNSDRDRTRSLPLLSVLYRFPNPSGATRRPATRNSRVAEAATVRLTRSKHEPKVALSMFSIISASLLLARSTPPDRKYMGFWYSFRT